MAAPTPPAGFTITDDVISPSKHYGFTVPNDDMSEADAAKAKNSLIDMQSGAEIAVLDSTVGFGHTNHGGVDAPWWAKDESAVLWKVDAKWGPSALVLIELENGKLKLQVNVLKLMQTEILARSKAAKPDAYAAAVKHNTTVASDYFPEGFTVDVEPLKPDQDEPGTVPPLNFPLKFHANLDSNPKQVEGFPKEAEVSTEMDAELSADGKITVTKFDVVQN